MANIKCVPRSHRDLISRSRHSAIPVTRSTPPTAANPAPSNALHLRPAAFPTRFTVDSLPDPVAKYGKHGIWPLIQARMKSDQAKLKLLTSQVDDMWNNTSFPANVDSSQKAWYGKLKDRWAQDTGHDQQVEFRSLYTTLRSTIIDQITNDVPKGVFLDNFLPAKTLLGLSHVALKEIMEENDEIWPTIDIPEHLQNLKYSNPERPIDPETPPERAIVRAIVFLMQRRLPASLLGRWQMPLPPNEAFKMYTILIQGSSHKVQCKCAKPSASDFSIIPKMAAQQSDSNIECAYLLSEYRLKQDTFTGALSDADKAHNTERSSLDLHEARRFHDANEARKVLTHEAKIQAMRLWTTHISKYHLRTHPGYLHQKAHTLEAATIQLELLKQWKMSIMQEVFLYDKHGIKAGHEIRYQALQSLLVKVVPLEQKRQTLIENAWKGQSGELARMPINTWTPVVAPTPAPTPEPSPAPAATPLPASRAPTPAPLAPERAKPPAKLWPSLDTPNFGFGDSTKIIPFPRPEVSSSYSKRPAENDHDTTAASRPPNKKIVLSAKVPLTHTAVSPKPIPSKQDKQEGY